MNTHFKNDPNLLPQNTDNYRYLIANASEKWSRDFFHKVRSMIGVAERRRENRDEIEEDEASKNEGMAELDFGQF